MMKWEGSVHDINDWWGGQSSEHQDHQQSRLEASALSWLLVIGLLILGSEVNSICLWEAGDKLWLMLAGGRVSMYFIELCTAAVHTNKHCSLKSWNNIVIRCNPSHIQDSQKSHQWYLQSMTFRDLKRNSLANKLKINEILIIQYSWNDHYPHKVCLLQRMTSQ